MVKYHHVKYQKKLMIQSRENFVTDRWTDRLTDESDFTESCQTSIEPPKNKVKYKIINNIQVHASGRFDGNAGNAGNARK